MGRAPSTEELPLLLGGLLGSTPQDSESSDEPRIVSFGGGHGLYAALRAFRLITENLTAVVTVADDGGSSGRLRAEMGGLPPGDLRMALAALCDDGEWGRVWRGVMQHRFASRGALDGHAVGNLLIAALWQIHEDHVVGLDWIARLLRAHGRVLPMSSVPLTIEADVVTTAAGARVDTRAPPGGPATPGRVEEVRLDPASPPARSETIAAVEAADVLNLGPGSWYTSVMPHLLVPQLADAIVRSRALKTLTLNLGAAPGETVDLSLVDHLQSLHRHAPDLRLDFVLVDAAAAAKESALVRIAAELFGAEVRTHPLTSRRPRQHDSLKLAACYRDLLLDRGLLREDTW
jgi:uncharacterized cofD-like protein